MLPTESSSRLLKVFVYICVCVYACIHTHTHIFFIKFFKKEPPVVQGNGAFPPGFLGRQPVLQSQTKSSEMGPFGLPSCHRTIAFPGTLPCLLLLFL